MTAAVETTVKLMECGRCGVKHEIEEVHVCPPYALRVKRTQEERDRLALRVKELEAKLDASIIPELNGRIAALEAERDEWRETAEAVLGQPIEKPSGRVHPLTTRDHEGEAFEPMTWLAQEKEISRLLDQNIDTEMRTIRALQEHLPWGAHNYSAMFQAYPAAHRDYAHAFLHVQKALGKLAPALDDADHVDDVRAAFQAHPPAGKYLADIIICAIRMAQSSPEGVIDMESALAARISQIEEKSAAKARGEDVR